MVALVTGASSGIGQACAELLADRGFRVYGASRRPLKSSSVKYLPMDVTDDLSVARTITELLATEKRVDVVVNNAGVVIAGAVEDCSPADALAQFEVNLFGVLRVCRAVLPVMREQRSGTIINIGSIGGLLALPYQGMYSASKFALEGLTESLRLEVRQFGINVVLVEPGDHRTELTHSRVKTEESQSNPAYRQPFDAAVARMARDEQQGPAPEAVAKLVGRIVQNPRPRLRYTTGPAAQRAAVWLKRLMPYALVEKIMTGYYSK